MGATGVPEVTAPDVGEVADEVLGAVGEAVGVVTVGAAVAGVVAVGVVAAGVVDVGAADVDAALVAPSVLAGLGAVGVCVIDPFDVSRAENAVASGALMLAAALEAVPPLGRKKPTPPGAGITMPIPPASRTIRCSS